jgi:hypothetical protein
MAHETYTRNKCHRASDVELLSVYCAVLKIERGKLHAKELHDL